MVVLMIAGLGYSQLPVMFGVEAHNPNYDGNPGYGFDLGTFYKLTPKDGLDVYGNVFGDISFYNDDAHVKQYSITDYYKDGTGRCHGPNGQFVKSELCDEPSDDNPKFSPAISLEAMLAFNHFLVGGGGRINSSFKP